MNAAKNIDAELFESAHRSAIKTAKNNTHHPLTFVEHLTKAICDQLTPGIRTRLDKVILSALTQIEKEKGARFLIEQQRAVYTAFLFQIANIQSETDTADKLRQLVERSDLPANHPLNHSHPVKSK